MVCGRGTQSILRARRACDTWSSGPSTSPLERGKKRHHFMQKLRRFMLLAAIVAAAGAFYSRLHTPQSTADTSAQQSRGLDSPSDTSGSQHSPFQCDGRAYCSQMTSCAEAKYFLEHCPNVKMDGDHDGVPCERQWCTSG